MAKKPSKAENIDTLLAIGVGAGLTAALHFFGNPQEWWLYLIVFVLGAAGAHQTAIRMRADKNQAYSEDA